MLKKRKTYVPSPRSEEALVWNDSVKLAAMLLHWNITTDYQELIRFMRMHQAWTMQGSFEQSDLLLEQLLDQWPVADQNPRIWACFHIGPYGLISRALLERGAGVAVLLKDEVYDEQYAVYVEHFRANFGHDPHPSELRFIRAGNKNSLIQLKSCLAEGLHVICFVDGQEGGASPKGRIPIQLHGMVMEARLGIATLSHWTDVPVRPLVLTVQNDRLQVTSSADYYVKTKEEYASLLQACFNLIAALPPKELIQWDFIPMLFDEYFSERLVEENEKTVFEKALWVPILVPDIHLLFDLRTGNGVKVSSGEHRKIYACVQNIMAKF